MGSADNVIKVTDEVKDRLDDLKPYKTMSYSELIEDMTRQYTPPRREPPNEAK